MNLLSIIAIAVGLAMDAFAVSISSGIIIKDLKLKNALKIGAFFGGFQALMPILGWCASVKFKDYIEKVDHWIAFILLALIGLKMIHEALKGDEENDEEKEFNPLNNKVLFFLAVATSIDALIVGISFALLDVSILNSAAIIGIITFVLSCIGVLIGKKSGELFKSKAEIVGGVLLTLMGVKILFQHLNINIVSVFNIFK